MDMTVGKDMIQVIRDERNARLKRLPTENPDVAYDQWFFTDEPFINELCLDLLVAFRHHIERELVWMAARVTSDGRELAGKGYRKRVRDERELLRKSNGWKKLIAKLKLATVTEWNSSMNTLRLLANSYKHNPSSAPDRDLQKHLGLDLDGNYADLPESQALKKGLSTSLGLQEGADYCDIADELLARVDRFLKEVQAQPVTRSPVKWGPVPIASFLQ